MMTLHPKIIGENGSKCWNYEIMLINLYVSDSNDDVEVIIIQC